MSVTQLTFTAPFAATDVTVLQAAVTNSGTFPADPTQATTPSPENSEITLYNGQIFGAPYLRDINGQTHQLVLASDSTAASPDTQYWINGAQITNGFFNGGYPVQLLVRQGSVYVNIATGQWQQFFSADGSMGNTGLPTAWTTPGGSTPSAPSLPALPTPSAIAPGSSGKVISCGTGQALATLSAAIPTAGAGDTIQLAAGTYTDCPPAWTVPLLVDLGGATFDATGQTNNLARGKGLLVPCADSIIRNGTITGVAMDQPTGQLTGAIRPDAGLGYLTVSNMQIHGCQTAIGEGGIGACVIELDSCDISNNGLLSNTGASLTHNLYVGQDCVLLTLNNVTSNGTSEGHAIKFRGLQFVVDGGLFASAPGKPFDLPNGTVTPFSITNAQIVKNVNDLDHGILGYGEEVNVDGPANGAAGGTISGGMIQAMCPNPYMIGPAGTITMVGVTLSGNPIVAQGGLTLAGS